MILHFIIILDISHVQVTNKQSWPQIILYVSYKNNQLLVLLKKSARMVWRYWSLKVCTHNTKKMIVTIIVLRAKVNYVTCNIFILFSLQNKYFLIRKQNLDTRHKHDKNTLLIVLLMKWLDQYLFFWKTC